MLAGLAALKLVLHAVIGGGYGFHQDEFYYLACGRHPAWGYVDQPFIVPWLGHLVELVCGAGITANQLHAVSAFAGALMVFLAGLMAREVGGRFFAQLLAALAVLSMPLFMASGELFQTVVFDQLIWLTASWLVLRIFRTGHSREWLWVGLVTGIGLETKYTIGLFGLGLAVALLTTRTGRQHLRTPWPWLAGGLAVACLVPNLLWQHANGWASAEFIHNSNANNRKDWTVWKFLLLQALFAGPAIGLAVIGAWRGISRRATSAERAAICIAGTAALLLLVLHGKAYYLGPILPLLAAIGSVAVAEWTRRTAAADHRDAWYRMAVVALLMIGSIILGPVALPILPQQKLAGSWQLRADADLAAHVGWPELVKQVDAAVHTLPAEELAQATLLSVNYEEAGAIQLLDPALAAQLPVVSPHNNYWIWGPGDRDPKIVIVVGARQRKWQEELFGQVQQIGTITTPDGVTNEWTGRGIWVDRQPKKSLRAAWPDLKAYE